jgi:glycosyltransferase involved in cell wall biosynthesis
MTDFPSVSIIIPSYNQGSYIERTLLSILKQDYPGEVEIIVSDGGSKDETVEVLKKYPQIKWWSEPDKGFVDAVAKGFAVAKGEILAIQSSDDFYLKDAFKVLVKELLENGDLGIVSGCDIYLQPDRKTFSIPDLDSHEITPKSLLMRRCIPQHCAFFRRSVFEKMNGLREDVDTCADIDFWYRSLHFFKAKFIPYHAAVYQFHDNQRTQVLDNWYSSYVKMVEYCEADSLHNTRFKFSKKDKKNLYVRWQIEDLKRKKDSTHLLKEIDEAMQNSEYTKETKLYIYGLAISQGLTVEAPTKKSIIEKIFSSISNGSLIEKVARKTSSNSHKVPQIDIDWWQKNE